MSRKPRRKLPDPVGYTTIGGTVERDLFLIRACRERSDNASFYTQLEARRLDAELLNFTTAINEITATAHRCLTGLGLTITAIGDTGAALHHVDVDALPPRLRSELHQWQPAPGAPPALKSRESVIPWMLLSRLPATRPASRAQARTLQIYRETHLRSRSVLQARVRDHYERPTSSNVERLRSHIRELGEARLSRYSRYDRKLYEDTRAALRLPQSLVGLPTKGITQRLARGTVSTRLQWHDNENGALVVHLEPKGNGDRFRYEIAITATELTAPLNSHSEPSSAATEPRKPSNGAPTDDAWKQAQQSTIDI